MGAAAAGAVITADAMHAQLGHATYQARKRFLPRP
jgi:hypothetical protein